MLLVFCWVRIWIVCQFELQRFEVFLDQLRPFEKFSPVPLSQLLTYAGSIAMTFDEPVLILCVLVWCISRGSDVVSGEINRGTLEFLLSHPISRLQLMAAHGIVCVLGLAGLCGCVLLGLSLGIQSNSVKETFTPTLNLAVPWIGMHVPVPLGQTETQWVPLASRVEIGLFVPALINLFGFGFLVLAFSVLCSACDRYRWRTIGIVVSCYVVELLLYLLSKSAEATSFCAGLTFFSFYQPDAIVQIVLREPAAGWQVTSAGSGFPLGLGPLGITAVLLMLGGICFTMAGGIFHRRDLPAPH
jgi:ABC-2 type transport system permease protein